MKRILLIILLFACTSAPEEPKKAEFDHPKRSIGIVGGTVSRAVMSLPPEPPPSTANYAAIAENGFVDTKKERRRRARIRALSDGTLRSGHDRPRRNRHAACPL
jgi:hypothetical protein